MTRQDQTDRFASWQRLEWRAVRDDGSWDAPELQTRDQARTQAWQHWSEIEREGSVMLTQMSRPPPGYSVTNGASRFAHRHEDST